MSRSVGVLLHPAGASIAALAGKMDLAMRDDDAVGAVPPRFVAAGHGKADVGRPRARFFPIEKQAVGEKVVWKRPAGD